MAILGASVQQASSPWNNASMTTVNHPLAGQYSILEMYNSVIEFNPNNDFIKLPSLKIPWFPIPTPTTTKLQNKCLLFPGQPS